MVNLFLLPFRGIVWLLLGLLCSLPWFFLALPLTTQYWLPKALSIWFETKTQFPCHIEAAKIDWKDMKLSCENVTVMNPKGFVSSDFLHFPKIDCSFVALSFLKETIYISDLSVECSRMISVNQTHNNLSLLYERFTNSPTKAKKSILIESFNFDFKGVTSTQNYARTISCETFWSKHAFHFKNVCLNLSPAQQQVLNESTTVESVYTNLLSLFRAHL